MVAKKDYNAPKHDDLEVPNLEVIKAMQSLTSQGYVKTQFSWQYYYYTLTNEGLEHLREWCAIRLTYTESSSDTDDAGFTYPPRLSPQRTRRLLALHDRQAAVVPAATVLTVLLVVTATSTVVVMVARRRVARLVATGQLTVVLAAEARGSDCTVCICVSYPSFLLFSVLPL